MFNTHFEIYWRPTNDFVLNPFSVSTCSLFCNSVISYTIKIPDKIIIIIIKLKDIGGTKCPFSAFALFLNKINQTVVVILTSFCGPSEFWFIFCGPLLEQELTKLFFEKASPLIQLKITLKKIDQVKLTWKYL